MTVPCSHTPPHPLDLRPCEPCAHCSAPAGVWCAPRCPRKLERTGDPAGNAGPERWPVEYFAGMRREAACGAPINPGDAFVLVPGLIDDARRPWVGERSDARVSFTCVVPLVGHEADIMANFAGVDPNVGRVYFAPVGRLVFYVAEGRCLAEYQLREVFGHRGVRIPAAALPDWLEDLGHPGVDLGPTGWKALRDGVLMAEDHAGRVEAVRTARERAAEYGPAGGRQG